MRRNQFMTLIMIVVLVAIIPPAMFGEARNIKDATGGDPWRNFIFDFQTIIAGIFAVFAAWWTVQAMERTDREQERRHRDLLALQLRTEYLAIDRFTDTFLLTSQIYRDQCLDIQKEIEASESLWAAIRPIAEAIKSILHDIPSMFNSRAYEAARPYLDPELVDVAENITRICDDTLDYVTKITDFRRGTGPLTIDQLRVWVEGNEDHQFSGGREIAKGFVQLNGRMRAFVRLIEIHKNRVETLKKKYPTITI